MLNKLLTLFTTDCNDRCKLATQLLISYFIGINEHEPNKILYHVEFIAALIVNHFKVEIPVTKTIEELAQVPSFQFPFHFEFGDISIIYTYVQYVQHSMHPDTLLQPYRVNELKYVIQYTGIPYFKKKIEDLDADLIHITTDVEFTDLTIVLDDINFYKDNKDLRRCIEFEIIKELEGQFGKTLLYHWFNNWNFDAETIYHLFEEADYEQLAEEHYIASQRDNRDGEKV